jgi:hypothetical protein
MSESRTRTRPGRQVSLGRSVSAAMRGATVVESDLRQAAEFALNMRGFANTTLQRRQRLRLMWQEVQRKHPQHHQVPASRVFAALIWQRYAPTTAVTYTLSAMSAVPELKGDADYADAVRWIRKEAAKLARKRKPAIPATPEQVRRLLADKQIAAGVKATIMTLYVTASRHADLAGCEITKLWRKRETSILRIEYRQFKSDLFGQRFVSKTVELTAETEAKVFTSLNRPVPYRRVWLAMKKQGLTVHSLRRGAVTQLTRLQVPPEHILLLTLHTMKEEPTAVRRYTDPTSNGPEQQVQRKLSKLLEREVLSQTATAQHRRQ